MKILSVERGYGKGSVFYCTDKATLEEHYVTSIKEEERRCGNEIFTVICGYLNDIKIFEMERNASLFIRYESLWKRENK